MTMEKQKKSYCGVLNCFKNSATHPQLSYFRLPKDAERAAVWLENIHRKKTKAKKILVCETHFESRYINVNETRKRLVGTACPTLNLPDTITFEFTPDYEITNFNSTIGTQTDDSLEDVDVKSRIKEEFAPVALKRKIRLQSEEPESKRFNYENIKDTDILLKVECISEDDSSINISKIMQLYTTMTEKRENEVYTDDFKFFALNLYFTSPNTYKVLQKTLKLPSISELYRLCIPKSSEINENLIRALKERVNNMTDDQKQCAVCIGTMALRVHLDYDEKKDRVIGFHEVEGVQSLEPAKFLLVVMVRGLFDDWKQAISYSLVAQYQSYKDVKKLIDGVFLRLFDIGLHVRVFISDNESEFMSATTERKITPEKPYFFTDNKKIYYMHDPPHNIRAVRDSLTNHDIHIGDAVIKWKYISDFYNIDKSRPLKLAPKLTFYHMMPNVAEKVKVSLAAQIFSNTTAAGISAFIDMKLLEETARDTVEWILKLDKLFDILNFSSFANENKTFKGEKWQIDFLNETLLLLDQIRIIGHGKGVDFTAKSKFIKGYKITINAVLSLYEHFKIENRKFLRPRFTRDCFDTFIEKVRAKYCVEPSCKSIISIIKNLPIFSIFLWNTNKKCSNDLDNFLKAANEISNVQVYKTFEDETPSKVIANLTTTVDYTNVELPKKDSVQFFSSYLLYEGYQKHIDCEVMGRYVFDNYKRVAGRGVLFKNSSKGNDIEIFAPEHFVSFIQALEIRFKSYFESQTVKNPIVTNLTQHLECVRFVTPCKCFPIDFIKELYVRCRFHMVLNYNIREFRNSKKCRKSFTVNVI